MAVVTGYRGYTTTGSSIDDAGVVARGAWLAAVEPGGRPSGSRSWLPGVLAAEPLYLLFDIAVVGH